MNLFKRILTVWRFNFPEAGQNLPLLSAGVISICAVFFISTQNNNNAIFSGANKHVSFHENKNKPDGPAAYMQQEVEATKDPALGIVPRERLQEAMKYMKMQEGSRGAIPNINWTSLGPTNIGGRTQAIMVDPNDATKKTIWAGGIGGGLWKTTDITASKPTWTPVDDFNANLAISSIVYDPTNTQRMYFGTGEGWFNLDALQGAGIFYSSNGGANWSQLASTNNSNFYYVNKLAVNPANGDVYAATRSGLYRSQNQGTNWTKVFGNGVSGGVTDRIGCVEIASNNMIYIGAGLFQNDGVYSSRTGNLNSWTKLNTGANGFPTSGFYRVEVACAPSDSNYVYATTHASSGNGVFHIYQSTNKGTSWTQKTNPTDADGGIGSDYTRTQAWYDLPITVDPNNSSTIWVGGIDLFKSTNGGTAWTQYSHWYGGFSKQYVHADQHIILYEPGSSNTIYFGNDGGIWRTSDGGTNIITKDYGYNVTQYYCCAMTPTAYSSSFYAGAQDNGSQWVIQPTSSAAQQPTGGDGCFCHIDQDQPQYIWTSYVYNTYYRSSDGGQTFTQATLNNNGGASFVNATDYDNTANIMYCADNLGRYVRWTNPQTGSTNARITITALNNSTVTAVTVSPNTANRVFFGTSGGRVVRVDGANTIASGSAGTNITGASFPAGTIINIEVQTGDDNHILALFSNYGVASIWETIDGGTNWTNVEGNLPDMPTRWAMFHPAHNKEVLLATELGVWSTDSLQGSSTVWAASNTGQANVSTVMFQYRSSDGLVIAATHGRGLYSSDIFAPAHADFISNHTVGYINSALSFTNTSYKAASYLWDFGDGNTSTLQNPTHAYSSAGTYTVQLTINGSLNKTRTNYIQILPNRSSPYTLANGGDFESNTSDFGSETIFGSAFQRGNSSAANKSGVNSGSNAWVTDLTSSNYLNFCESYLYSPNFDCSANGTYTVGFYSKYNCETNYDGFIVEYSFDKGQTWTQLGTAGGTWYNYANTTGQSSFSPSVPFFTGSNANYTSHSFATTSFSFHADVALRFAFKTDNAVTAAGAAIDDVDMQFAASLPVELISFDGKNEGDNNKLNWETASEFNNAGFTVERSTDAKTFKAIGYLKGKGFSLFSTEYNFMDDNISADYYYRLVQTDFDGTKNYSNIIFIKSVKSVSNLFVFPNPCSNFITVSLLTTIAESFDLTIFSLDGKEIYKTKGDCKMNNFYSLQDKIVTAGTYLAVVEYADKKEFVKLVKQ